MKLKIGYFGIGRLTFDTRLAEKNFQLISKKINLKYKNSIGIEKIVYTEIDAKNLIKFFKKNPCDYYIAIQTTFTDAKFIVEFSKIFPKSFCSWLFKRIGREKIKIKFYMWFKFSISCITKK